MAPPGPRCRPPQRHPGRRLPHFGCGCGLLGREGEGGRDASLRGADPGPELGTKGRKARGLQPACRGVPPLAADLGSARAPHPTRTRGVPASDPGSTYPACQGLGLTAPGTCTSCLRADISHARHLQVSRLRRRGTNHGKCRVLAIRMSPCSATSLATWPEVKGSGQPPPHPEPGSKLPRRATTSLDAAGMRGHPGPTQSLPWGPGVRARSALSHPASDPAPRPGLPCSPPACLPGFCFCVVK